MNIKIKVFFFINCDVILIEKEYIFLYRFVIFEVAF